MSSIFSCNPGSVWAPFDDPIPEELKIIDEIILRINEEEKYKKLEANIYEKKATHIKRFLQKNSYDVESTLHMWSEWVQWRQKNLVNEITEEEIMNEKAEGILSWRGHNKDNMNCLLITGRFLDPINRKGTSRSFKRYLIKTIEDGLQATDDSVQDKLCIIYDRRGLEFQHIDPNLFQFCKPVLEEMQVFIYPTMSLINPTFNQKFVMLDKTEDLLTYFDQDQLLLNAFDPDTELSVIPPNNEASLENTKAEGVVTEESKQQQQPLGGRITATDLPPPPPPSSLASASITRKVDPTFDMSR